MEPRPRHIRGDGAPQHASAQVLEQPPVDGQQLAVRQHAVDVDPHIGRQGRQHVWSAYNTNRLLPTVVDANPLPGPRHIEAAQ